MELKYILESVLFSAQKPLSTAELREVLAGAAQGSEDTHVLALAKTKAAVVESALEELARDHAASARSYRLACVAGSWQFVTQPEYVPWLRAFVGVKNRPTRLSAPALETLAIIAYRQPVTRAEIEQIRGVSVDGVMQTLLERDLVVAVGRAEVVGRPVTYGTTSPFLEYFGLKDLDDLPSADELRRIPVQKPEALVTTENGNGGAQPVQVTMENRDEVTPEKVAEVVAHTPLPEPSVEGTVTGEQAGEVR